MKNFLLILFVSFTLFTLPGCSSGSNVGDIVCDYGDVLCDVSTTLCRDIPGVPNQVCNYLDLACYNLNTICELRDSTDAVQYQNALSNIKLATEKLRAWHVANNQNK